MNQVLRTGSGIEHDGYGASGRVRDTPDKPCGQIGFRYLLECLVAPQIVANGADKADTVSESVGMEGKVEWRTAQMFGIWQNVP